MALVALLVGLHGAAASGVVPHIGLKTVLTVTIAANAGGPATGTVTSAPPGISCPPTCTHSFSPSILPGRPTTVTLTATPDPGYAAPDWLVDGHSQTSCSGATATCAVKMDLSHSVQALFNYFYKLTVTKTGTGHGVVSEPHGLDCGAVCTVEIPAGHVAGIFVYLTSTPDADSTFDGWTGCTSVDSNGRCEVYIPFGTTGTATAAFTLKRFDLTVNRNGTGSGTVTSNPVGINCGGDCKETYDAGTKVALQATSAADSTFTGFAGACTGTGACVVTMDAAKSVTATFDLVPQGGGGGTGGGTGGGSGGGSGGGAADQTVDAHIVSVKVLRLRHGKRIVQIELSAGEVVTVDLTLIEKGKTLATRHVAHFAAGDRMLKLTIPGSAKAGAAKLNVALADAVGNTNAATRSVRIPVRRT